LTDADLPPWGSYMQRLAAAPDGPPPDAGVTPDDLFNIMYTSGTTGLPKGIMHSHRIRANYALLLGPAWRMTPESVVLHTGAIVFNGAFVTLMPAFHLGATYILQRQFDARSMLAAIARERVTHIMVVPAQIIALLDSPEFDPTNLQSLQMILSLGAPLAQARKDQLNALLPGRFHELYGLTEGFLTILDKTDAVRKSGSVGCPPVFSDVRIVDDAGHDLPAGEAGEIVGRGPFVMQGYWGKPELTAQTLRDGWIFSGDIGHLDAEGYLYLVDRKKDMIDSGGVKVYPRDIEDIASRHPEVAEVAVFGVPHETWGETPLAAIVLKVPNGTQSAPGNPLRGHGDRTARLDQRTRRRALPARARRHDPRRLPAQRGGQDPQARNARTLLGGTGDEDMSPTTQAESSILSPISWHSGGNDKRKRIRTTSREGP
jgi:long-chain acyl-CoA synthetase